MSSASNEIEQIFPEKIYILQELGHDIPNRLIQFWETMIEKFEQDPASLKTFVYWRMHILFKQKC